MKRKSLERRLQRLEADRPGAPAWIVCWGDCEDCSPATRRRCETSEADPNLTKIAVVYTMQEKTFERER